jgi:hypothetical protein
VTLLVLVGTGLIALAFAEDSESRNPVVARWLRVYTGAVLAIIAAAAVVSL